MKAGKALSVEKIQVRADRIIAQVVVDPVHAYTTASLAQRVLQQRPNLAHHACINDAGPTFAMVIDHTPLPHLFEHLVVDNLAQRATQENVIFTGTSEWVNREKGQARVEVSYNDDLEALSALKEAEEFLNNMTAS